MKILRIILPVTLLGLLPSACGAKPPSNAAREQSLQALVSKFGFPKPTISGSKIQIKSRYTSMTLERDSRRLLFNDHLIWMNEPVTMKGASWVLSAADSACVIRPLLRPRDHLPGAPPRTIVVDPGHGGPDTGAIGRSGSREKDLVLDIAKKLRQPLAAAGIRTVLTRSSDREVSLSARSRIARRAPADLFISIHLNSAGNRKATGVETYIIPSTGHPSTSGQVISKTPALNNRYDASNQLLAYYIHKNVLTATGAEDRGIKRARFDVISNAACPAVLIECGFVSNSGEEKKLLKESYRQKIATGIANGIIEMKNQIKETKKP